jgi:hypothetical protein
MRKARSCRTQGRDGTLLSVGRRMRHPPGREAGVLEQGLSDLTQLLPDGIFFCAEVAQLCLVA